MLKIENKNPDRNERNSLFGIFNEERYWLDRKCDDERDHTLFNSCKIQISEHYVQTNFEYVFLISCGLRKCLKERIYELRVKFELPKQ